MFGLDGSFSFRLLSVRGIPIRIHFSFLLLLPVLALSLSQAFIAAARSAGLPAGAIAGTPLLWGLAVALGLFAAVLVHELSHALYAVRRGGKVEAITLLMIGGVAQLSEPPRRARDEAVMAAVGPLTSFVLGVAFYGAHVVSRGLGSFNLSFALFYLALLNVFLAVFNLLPAFPMDGGRVVRALLVGRLGMSRATRVAGMLGKGFAVLFAAAGLLTGNVMLLLIAFFVFLGAGAEAQQVEVKGVLEQLHVRDAMRREVPTIPAGASVAEVVDRMVDGGGPVLVVVRGGDPEGIVTVDALRAVPRDRRREVTAGEIGAAVPAVSPSDNLWSVVRLLGRLRLERVPVVELGAVVGMVGSADISQALRLHELRAQEAGQARRGRRRVEV
jgi:Zn-dependent protease